MFGAWYLAILRNARIPKMITEYHGICFGGVSSRTNMSLWNQIWSPCLSCKSIWVSNNCADTGTLWDTEIWNQLESSRTYVVQSHWRCLMKAEAMTSEKGQRADTCSQDGASVKQNGSIICSSSSRLNLGAFGIVGTGIAMAKLFTFQAKRNLRVRLYMMVNEMLPKQKCVFFMDGCCVKFQLGDWWPGWSLSANFLTCPCLYKTAVAILHFNSNGRKAKQAPWLRKARRKIRLCFSTSTGTFNRICRACNTSHKPSRQTLHPSACAPIPNIVRIIVNNMLGAHYWAIRLKLLQTRANCHAQKPRGATEMAAALKPARSCLSLFMVSMFLVVVCWGSQLPCIIGYALRCRLGALFFSGSSSCTCRHNPSRCVMRP